MDSIDDSQDNLLMVLCDAYEDWHLRALLLVVASELAAPEATRRETSKTFAESTAEISARFNAVCSAIVAIERCRAQDFVLSPHALVLQHPFHDGTGCARNDGKVLSEFLESSAPQISRRLGAVLQRVFDAGSVTLRESATAVATELQTFDRDSSLMETRLDFFAAAIRSLE